MGSRPGWRPRSGRSTSALLAFLRGDRCQGPALGADPPIGTALDAGRAWLLALVLTVWSFDTFAYAVGPGVRTRPLPGAHLAVQDVDRRRRRHGRRRGRGDAARSGRSGANPALGVVLGLLIAVTAQVGDVAESMLKRAAGAKDSGRLIAGHGGVLDRVNSIIFAAPAMYFFLFLLAPPA